MKHSKLRLLQRTQRRNRILLGLLAVVGINVATISRTGSAELTVCSSGCDFTSIQAAANGAADGDTISLLITSAHTENDIVINRSVTIDGLGESNTIIQAAATPGTAPNRVFFIADGLSVDIADMTIRHGNTNSTGGGIHNQGSDVTLTNVHVRNNEAADGGGIYSVAGTLTLINSWVLSNTIFSDGGGVYSAGTLIVTDSEISNNVNRRRGAGIFNSGVATISGSMVSFNDSLLSSGTNAKGGGIYSEGNLIVIDSTVRSNDMAGATNSASFIGGGGIYFAGTEFQLINSSVENNNVSSEQGGGGLFLNGDLTTISHSAISNNVADGAFSNTGGILAHSGTLVITDSTVSGNNGDLFGGGIDIGSTVSADITNTTIYDNESDFGAGLYVCNSKTAVNLTNVTISTNRASKDGGGIYVCSVGEVSLASATITANRADNDDNGSGNGGGIYLHTFNTDSGIANLRNTIIADNLDLSDFPDISSSDCFGELNSEAYNLIGSLGFSLGSPPCSIVGDVTGNLVGPSEVLGMLADYGGPTLTHALTPFSAAINAGNPAGCTDPSGNPLPTDQRGGVRPDRCDIGAFELGALPIFADGFESPEP